MTKAKQTDRVLAYIREFGSITQLEALRDLGVFRLASRISDLKNKVFLSPARWKRSRTDTARSATSSGTEK